MFKVGGRVIVIEPGSLEKVSAEIVEFQRGWRYPYLVRLPDGMTWPYTAEEMTAIEPRLCPHCGKEI